MNPLVSLSSVPLATVSAARPHRPAIPLAARLARFLLALTALIGVPCTGLVAASGLSGCTYETVNEYQQEVTAASVDAGAPDSGELADAGAADGQDAGDDVGKASVGTQGASGYKVLTRGNPSPTTILTENFKDQAGVYTVQFSTRPQGAVSVPANVAQTLSFAQVTWAIDGVQIQRIITIANGLTLTGVGAGCTILVWDATTVAPGDPVPNYLVSVTLTPGNRGSNGNPPTYYPPFYYDYNNVQHPGSAGSIVTVDHYIYIPVPLNAGIVSVQVTVGTNAAAGLTPGNSQVVMESNGAPLAAYDPIQFSGFIPIDPQTTFIQVVDFLPTATILYWSVVFGVDG